MPDITYRGLWRPGHTYGPGSLVRRSDGGLYLYTASQPQRSSTPPGEDAAHWTAVVAGDAPPPPPPGSYSDAVMADSPLVYYPLSDASGASIPLDISGNNRTLTASGAGVTWGTVTGPVGTDTCAVFSGDFLYSAVTAGLPIGAGPYTLEAWASFGADTSWGVVCYGKGSFGFGPTEDNHDNAIVELGSNTITHTTNNHDFYLSRSFGLDTWHYLVVTNNGSNAAWYLDGVLQEAEAFVADIILLEGPLFLGAYMGASHAGAGKLAHVAIYGTALSADRVTAHHNAAGG